MYKLSVMKPPRNPERHPVDSIRMTYESFEDLVEPILKGAYSPNIWDKSYRLAKNFLSCNILVYDIDDGTTIEQAKERLKEWTFIIAPTASHQKSEKIKNGKATPIEPRDRFRILLPLSQEIRSLDVLQHTLSTFAKQHQLAIDKACLDGARYFKPSTSIAHINHGKSIDPAVPQGSSLRGQLRDSTKAFIDNPPPPEHDWSTALWHASRDCYEQLYTKEECLEILRPALSKNGWVDWDEDDLDQIERAYSKPPKYPPRIGNPYDKAKVILNREDRFDNYVVTPEWYAIEKLDLDLHKKELAGRPNIVAKFEYNPRNPVLLSQDPRGRAIFNTYTPPDWMLKHFYLGEPIPKSELPKIYEEFFKFWTDGDEASYNYLLDWLANSLRERNLTFLVAVSKQGTGKTQLYYIMRALHGDSNSYKGTDRAVKGHFNAQVVNRTLFNIDELCISSDDGEALDRLKAFSNPTLEAEAKGKDAVELTNYINCYISSNRLNCIDLDADDRRFSIVEFTDKPLRKEKGLFEKRPQLLDPENIERLAQYLWHREITNNMAEPFRAERKTKKMRDASLKNWHRVLLRMHKDKTEEIRVPLDRVGHDLLNSNECPELRSPISPLTIEHFADRYPEHFRVEPPDLVFLPKSNVVSLSEHKEKKTVFMDETEVLEQTPEQKALFEKIMKYTFDS